MPPLKSQRNLFHICISGDMKLTPRQKSAMVIKVIILSYVQTINLYTCYFKIKKSRNAVPNFLQKWTNGLIPYEVSGTAS